MPQRSPRRSNRQIPVMEATEAVERRNLNLPQTLDVRVACNQLLYAMEAIAARGAAPAVDPRTPGEIICYVLALKQRGGFRPAGWESRLAEWTRHKTPLVREVLLLNPPRPCPIRSAGYFWLVSET